MCGRSQESPMTDQPSIRYASGEDVLAGDEVTYFGNSGRVEFVADPERPTPETEWYVKEFGSGAMVSDSKIGQVFLSPERDLDELLFVRRGK